MKLQKHEREWLDMLKSEGAEIVELRPGTRHLRATLRAPDGRTAEAITGRGTSIDTRARKNSAARLRRWLAGEPVPYL